MDRAALALNRGLSDGFRPDSEMSLSEWADDYRVLVAETTREHGRWRTERTPYLRDIMDDLSPASPIRHVALMKGAQLGGSEMLLNMIGYVIHNTPGPMMYVNPTIELAEDSSKDRVSPMIQAVPELAALVRENRSRASGNTVLEKKFRNGFLKMAGANSAVSLRAKAIRFLLRDEIDAYPEDVDGEGDPLALSEERTNTYTRTRKILDVSTPTIKDVSNIERLYLASDQRRYHIPCPHCGHADYLTWRDVGHHSIEFSEADPESAHMVCGGCGASVGEHFKPWMLERGAWVPGVESWDGLIRGYHISALYSPLGWYPWAEIVRRFQRAKKDRSLLKVWVNTNLGETWREDSDAPPEVDVILARAERYPAEVPAGVGALIMAVDVQADRLEWKIKGYGADEESWLIARSSIPGDPEKDDVWAELDDARAQRWLHESGQKLRIDLCVIDSNFCSNKVYQYCRMRADQRVYAVRGGSVHGVPLVGRPTANNAYRARLYTLCVDTGKDTIFARLRIGRPQPGMPMAGYMHLPEGTDRDYVEQLTAERPISKWVPRQGTVRTYKKIEGRRNEALDQEVYALAGLHILGLGFVRGLAERARRYAQPVLGLEAKQASAEAEAAPAAPADVPLPAPQAPRRPQRGGWVRNWRR
jgi:phage terminase large subunit GpA-like protein